MPSDLYNEEDEDIYGIPRRVNEAHTRWNLPSRRKLLPVIAILGLILLGWTAWPTSSKTDWSRFAYVSYATDDNSLCSAYMLFEALDRLGSKAERVLLYNAQWATESEGGTTRPSALLTRAERQYHVRIKPVQLLDERGETALGTLDRPSTWDTSITQLRAFELTEYDRVLSLENDITLYQNLDELFLLPKTPVAMPRRYWTHSLPGQPRPLSSMMVLLEPNPAELQNMLDMLRSWRMDPKTSVRRGFTAQLLDNRFGASALVIPHRPYALSSAEFRRRDHAVYLGTVNAPQSQKSSWDADAVLKEAKLVHFNDWPLPKPYVMWPHDAVLEIQPNCSALHPGNDAAYSCREREIWKDLYNDFRLRRKDLCALLSVSAPNWADWKKRAGAG